MEASYNYKFGPYKIAVREVFHSTPLSYAMVNLRPLLPGNNRSPVRLIGMGAARTAVIDRRWRGKKKIKACPRKCGFCKVRVIRL
jgi:hypothetical protein